MTASTRPVSPRTASRPKSSTSPMPLSAGTPAPPFALPCGQHCAATLSDYRGKPLVLAFYVADWHPVCTAQLERYRDLGPELDWVGAKLVAVSADTIWSHAAFARAHQLPFPLLSDSSPRGGVAYAYGVYAPKTTLPTRALFVVDASGLIVWSGAFPEALDPGVDGILSALESLGKRNSTSSPAPQPRLLRSAPARIADPF